MEEPLALGNPPHYSLSSKAALHHVVPNNTELKKARTPAEAQETTIKFGTVYKLITN